MPSTTPPSTLKPAASSLEPCRCLDWDSQFFGLNVGRVNPARLRREEMPGILEWCARHQIQCLYFLADAADPETSQLASEHGFVLVDIRLTLERALPLEPAPAAGSPTGIRPFQPGDLPALQQLAAHLHEDTRFFFDRHFPSVRSRELYRVWMERSCLTPGHQVFVFELDSSPAGYIACAAHGDQTGEIELVGVGSRAQGRGAGSGLVRAGLNWLAAQGARQVTVVTQGRNTRAQRLYQRAGFVTQTLQLWYHLWLPRPEPLNVRGPA